MKPPAGGRTISKRITVKGDGDVIAQLADVSLTTGPIPTALNVAVIPVVLFDEVSPGNPTARFVFNADISCKPGTEGSSWAIQWFATISAGQNRDDTNDELEGRSEVTCK